jgi:uncharacterized LabA/DUF88 family protein
MAPLAKQVLERLEPPGLARALADLLDQPELVRLANACGLKYPGMRAKSQSRERLLADLVERSRSDAGARNAIFRALDKEATAALREWASLGPEERARRLADESFVLANGNLGLHLYLLARAPEAGESGVEARSALMRRLENGTGAAAPAREKRPEGRMRKKVHELERKIAHLETQLAKAREAHKTAKSDLIQRKGELAESRMLAERLRRELTDARATASAVASEPAAPASDAVSEIAGGLRKLAAGQKRLAQQVERLARSREAAGEAVGSASLVEQLAELKAELAKLGELPAQQKSLAKKIDQIGSTRRRPSVRRQGEPARVGVFIDVQNVYYGARRLKGKLDFDALLGYAVRDRRLIAATAYVVESSETNQSQFIGMLEKRAIEVRRKALTVRADGSMKGDWDMELALDILDAAKNLDVVVLVSGDGDFTALVRRVKASGPRVEVIAFPRHAAKALIEVADEFLPLDRKFMIRPARKAGGPTPAKDAPLEDGAEELVPAAAHSAGSGG